MNNLTHNLMTLPSYTRQEQHVNRSVPTNSSYTSPMDRNTCSIINNPYKKRKHNPLQSVNDICKSNETMSTTNYQLTIKNMQQRKTTANDLEFVELNDPS
jgi:hypothetical protein